MPPPPSVRRALSVAQTVDTRARQIQRQLRQQGHRTDTATPVSVAVGTETLPGNYVELYE